MHLLTAKEQKCDWRNCQLYCRSMIWAMCTYNANETGLFFNILLDKTSSMEQQFCGLSKGVESMYLWKSQKQEHFINIPKSSVKNHTNNKVQAQQRFFYLCDLYIHLCLTKLNNPSFLWTTMLLNQKTHCVVAWDNKYNTENEFIKKIQSFC